MLNESFDIKTSWYYNIITGEHLPAVRLSGCFLFIGRICMFNFVWPIALVIFANVIYNITTKSTPADANAFLSLVVTYCVAAICAFLMYIVQGNHQKLSIEFSRLNWTAVILGVCIVALEFGYIYVYRAGWKINTASLTANISLACILVVVGLLFYHEGITLRQIIGIGACAAGLLLIGK